MKINFKRLTDIADDLEKIAKVHQATGIELDLAMGILVYRIAHIEGHHCKMDQLLQQMMESGEVEFDEIPPGELGHSKKPH